MNDEEYQKLIDLLAEADALLKRSIASQKIVQTPRDAEVLHRLRKAVDKLDDVTAYVHHIFS